MQSTSPDTAPGDDALSPAASETSEAFELRSFGRRRGRKPSPHQQHLLDVVFPTVAVDLAAAPEAMLAEDGDTWLEIGFGGGEHLLWQARANSAVRLIGCEPFQDGVVKVLSAISEERLANIRLHDNDARPLLRALPAASIARAFVLFPDPWPKKRHVKRRLLNPATVDHLARVLRPGAELRIATDIADYVRTLLLAVGSHPAFTWNATKPGDWRLQGDDWPRTRYQEKALREGRRCYFFTFYRR